MLRDIAVILTGYLLGSIPFAYLITRATTGQDIRREGDSNVGTRNVMRVAGTGPGLFNLLLDGGKGAAAYWVGRRWGSTDAVLYLTGFALMLGHGFPLWLGWHGGKGLACASGFLSQRWPYSVLIGLAALLVAQLFIPNFDLSFGAAAATFFVLTFLEGNSGTEVLFIVLLLGSAGVKRLVDLPRERALRIEAGWSEGTGQDQVPRINHQNSG